jgi:hypothetical protein
MSRIANRQRQMAEQGRLRCGYTTEGQNGKLRPVKSNTWIVTSHSEEHVRAAAALWGGEAERWQPQGNGAQQWRVITNANAIDAILPPGDPLTQAYETWSRGGCQLRCDGITEQLQGGPCVCFAKFGENWHEQPKGRVCDSKSRLKVLLPDMPGLGVWRMETGSYYATDEIAGMVDVIRGSVGDQTLVPVRLRIEPRMRVADGQTKQFIVPVLELRGVTAGELLSGNVTRAAIGGAPATAAAIEAKRPDYLAEAQAATTAEQVMEIWTRANDARHMTPELHEAIGQIGRRLKAADTEPKDAEVVDESAVDVDAVWQQIVTVAGGMDMDLFTIEQDFASKNQGLTPESAKPADLQAYLADLERRAAA